MDTATGKRTIERGRDTAAMILRALNAMGVSTITVRWEPRTENDAVRDAPYAPERFADILTAYIIQTESRE